MAFFSNFLLNQLFFFPSVTENQDYQSKEFDILNNFTYKDFIFENHISLINNPNYDYILKTVKATFEGQGYSDSVLEELAAETFKNIMPEIQKMDSDILMKSDVAYKHILNIIKEDFAAYNFPKTSLEELAAETYNNMKEFFINIEAHTNITYNIFTQISSELFFFSTIFIVFCYSLYNSKRENYGYPLMQTNTIFLSILVLLLTLFLFENQTNFISGTYSGNLFVFDIFNNHFCQSKYYIVLKELLLIVILVIFLLSLNYTRYNNNVSYEFSILLLLSTWSMCLLISSVDLISIYLVIELQSFCFYILTATKSNSNFSTEAGLKYFILGSFSSGLLLFGISILYGFTGLTNLDELKILFYNIDLFSQMEYNNTLSVNSIAINFSLILIIIGILFKFGLVPFHMYIPDVYTGAPTIVTTLFLVIQKFVILIVYVNLYNTLFVYYFNNLNYFIVFSILLSIVVGSVTALAQSKIKRLVAYSAIVNGGFLLLGVAVGTIDGLCSSLLFLFIYITLILTLFSIYLSVKNQYNNKKLAGFKDFILLKKTNLMLAISFALVLFSIAGIPPLAGFYGKLFLFTSVIKEGSYALALIAILFTVVTAYYYIRLVKIMFFEKTLKFGFFTQVSKIDAYIISIGTVFNLVFFTMPKLFFVFINTLLLNFYFVW